MEPNNIIKIDFK